MKSIQSCSICGTASSVCGEKNANYSCNDHFTGVPQFVEDGRKVAYCRCSNCGFLFTTDFDSWTPDDFANNIYNAEYIKTDPPFLDKRPTRNAVVLSSVLRKVKPAGEVSLLDYGSGAGVFASSMRDAGFNIEAYDPYYGGHIVEGKQYDLITAFEVVEHIRHTEQHDLFAKFSELLVPGGSVLFSTRILNGMNDDEALNWWYVAPRNGHVSIHDKASINHLAKRNGFYLHSFNEDVHLAFKLAPGIASQLILENIDRDMDLLAQPFD